MNWLVSVTLTSALISVLPGACFEPGYVYSYAYSGRIEVGASSSVAVDIEGTLNVDALTARHLALQIDAEAPDDDAFAGAELGAEFHVELDGAGSVSSLWYPNGSNATHSTINYHKGLASLFGVRFPTDGSRATTYSAMQDEVTGRCENVYDWSPSATSNCTGYRLYKTRNFDRCAESPTYNVMAPAGWRCRPTAAVCESVQSRSLVVRTDVCAEAGGALQIVYVESREDWISLPWGVQRTPYNSMSAVQRLRLARKRRSAARAPSVGGGGVVRHSAIFTPAPEAPEADEAHAADWLLDKIAELRRIVFDTPELIRRRASIVRRQLLARFRSLSPAALDVVTEKAYRHLGALEWSLYVQHVAAVGSAAALGVVKRLMEQGRVSAGDATAIVSGVGVFVREPSDRVLAQLLSLLDVDLVRREARVRQTAMVSLASFFRTACIDRLAAATRFPLAWPPAAAASRRRDADDYWPTRLVERLAVQLDAPADRYAVLSAFNIIGHPSIVAIVVPIIEGKIDANPLVRTKAVLALHKLAHHGNKDAIAILHTVFANPSENYQVRMGAFTLLMLSNPADRVWQGVAARTWFEPRVQVASFVYTTLETLASLRSPIAFLQKLSQQAKKVLPLAKRVPRRRSANFIWSYEHERRLLATYLRLETFADKASDVPKELYGRLNVNLGAVDFDLLEFEMHAHHSDALLDETLARRPAPCPAPAVDALFRRLDVAHHAEQPSEGYIRSSLVESFESFWSFNARSLAAAMDAKLIGEKIEWYGEWPVANVELRWPNSMGFLNEAIVTGRITGTLNGFVRAASRAPSFALDAQLRPTLALSIDAEFGVRVGRSTLSTNSSALLLASLPGRTSVQLERDALKLHWSTTDDDDDDEMILFHKSVCADGSCGSPSRHHQQQAGRRRAGGQTFDEILSALGFAWLPGSMPGSPASPRQWSLPRSSRHLRLTLHFGDVGSATPAPIGWIMKSGKLLQSTERHGGEPLAQPVRQQPAPVSPLPEQFQLPARVALALTKALVKAQQDTGVIEVEWTSPASNASRAYVQSMPAPSVGECRISSLTVDTFDGLTYEPQMRDGCQYVAAAATGRRDKFAVLLHRQSPNRNKAVRIMVNEDVVIADVTESTLTVNNVTIPLDPGTGEAFLLDDECFGTVLLARKVLADSAGERLVIELPNHGVALDIQHDVTIKAAASLRGRLQGLCGDMNGETLFELRGPRRCVLASGALMAAEYEASAAGECARRQLPPAARDAASCPRQEGAPTVIRLQ